MELSARGIAFIKGREGCRLVAYRDQRGVPTIGFGHTLGVKMGDTCSQSEANKWLVEDTEVAQHAVNQLVTVPLNQNQFDALVIFTFNVGSGAFKNSTLLSLLNQGATTGAANQFLAWNHVDGVVSAGLTNRRMAERTLFLEPVQCN